MKISHPNCLIIRYSDGTFLWRNTYWMVFFAANRRVNDWRLCNTVWTPVLEMSLLWGRNVVVTPGRPMLKDHFYPHPPPQCGALQKVVWLPKHSLLLVSGRVRSVWRSKYILREFSLAEIREFSEWNNNDFFSRSWYILLVSFRSLNSY